MGHWPIEIVFFLLIHGDVPHRCYFAPPLRHLLAARGAVSQLEPSSRAARFGHEESISGWQQPSVLKNQTVKKMVVDWVLIFNIYIYRYMWVLIGIGM